MRIDELINEAELAYELNDIGLAEKKINHALVLDSQNFEARKIQALIFMQSEREKEGKEILDELLQEDDQAFDLLFFKAVYLYEMEKYDEALNLCDIMIDNIPEFYTAFSIRGLIKYNLNEKDQAYSDLDYAIKKDRKNPMIHYHRGIVKLRDEKNKEAIKDFRKALKLDKHFIEAKVYMASALRMLGEKSKALKTLSDIDIDEELESEELVQAAVVYQKNGQLLRSLDLIKKALSIDPSCVSAHYTRFTLNTKKHRFEEAKKDLDNALSYDDGFYRNFILNGYAYLSYEKREFQKAIGQANKALIEYPDFFWLNLTLAEVYGAMEEYDKFYKNLEIAIRGGIGFEDIDESIREKYAKDNAFRKLTEGMKKTGPYG